MFEKITSAPKKVKNHVVNHRAKYATAITVVVCYKTHRNVVASFNDFLEEKGLLDEYYLVGE